MFSIVILGHNGVPAQVFGPFESRERALNYRDMYFPGSGQVVPHNSLEDWAWQQYEQAKKE